MKTKKQDFELMRILKVHEISRIICETNMGVLKLRIRKGESDYRFVLDSVELPKELHREIYELLYAPEIPQVNVANQLILQNKFAKDTGVIIPVVVDPPKGVGADLKLVKQRGRPAGSKNKNESTQA